MNVINYLKRLWALLFYKKNEFCPICNQNTIFLPLPDFYLENYINNGFKYFDKGEMTSLKTYSCANCGASDRERLYAYWINNEIIKNNISENAKLIHFAPEPALSQWIKSFDKFNYLTADLMMDGVDCKVDMMNMPFKNMSFDYFICSHVLEHVNDDDKAIQELYRILKKDGWGILMAPIIVSFNHTKADPDITREEERWRHFGQNDHLRLYAHDDYVKKIMKHGFTIHQYNIKYFGKATFDKLGLKKTSILYIVEKR